MPNLNPNYMLPYIWTCAWKQLRSRADGVEMEELIANLTPTGLLRNEKAGSRHVANSLARLCSLNGIVEVQNGRLHLCDHVHDELDFRVAVGHGLLVEIDGDAFRKEGGLLLANASQIGAAWTCLQRHSPTEEFNGGTSALLDEQFGPDRGFLRAQAPWDPLVWVMRWSRFATVLWQGGTHRVVAEPSEYVRRALKTIGPGQAQFSMQAVRDHVARELPVLAEGTLGRMLAATAETPETEWGHAGAEGWVSAPLHRALQRLELRGILRINYGDDSMDRLALLGPDGAAVMASSVIMQEAA